MGRGRVRALIASASNEVGYQSLFLEADPTPLRKGFRLTQSNLTCFLIKLPTALGRDWSDANLLDW